MKNMFLFSIWLSSEIARCQKPKIQIAAQEGGPVKISCPYDAGYEDYPKYFSKGDYGKRSTLIYIRKKFKDGTENGKYSLWDDTIKRILHVTIYNLNLSDGGTYWCRIDTYTFDPITEIKLKVYKAPVKPPPVHSKPRISTTAQAVVENQEQPKRTTDNTISTTLWAAPPENVHTELPALAKVLYLSAAAAAVLLLSLLLILYFTLRKHGQETARAITGQEAGSWNTCSRDGASLTQREKNIHSEPSTEARGLHIDEDVHLLYSTVSWRSQRAAQPGGLSRAAAGTSEIYATIRHPQT